jgi:chitinase
MPGISVTSALTVLEGQPAQFVVTMDPVSTSEVTVQYSTADGNGPTGAIADVDYVPAINQTLTFAPGESRKTISVATISNVAVQPRRTFELRLLGSSGAVLQNSLSIATIRDGDAGGAVLDVDVSGGSAAAQSDGLLVFAVLAGVTNSQQLGNLLSADAAVLSEDVVTTVGVLRDSLQLDVDGNGSVNAQSDGLLVFAVLAGVTNEGQLSSLIGSGATRSVPEIIAYIENLKNPAGTSSATAAASSAPVLAAVLDEAPSATAGSNVLNTFAVATSGATMFASSTAEDSSGGDRYVAPQPLLTSVPSSGAGRSSGLSSSASVSVVQVQPSVASSGNSSDPLQNLDSLFEGLPEFEDWLLLA